MTKDSVELITFRFLNDVLFQLCRDYGLTDTYVAEHIAERLVESEVVKLSFNVCNGCRKMLGIPENEFTKALNEEALNLLFKQMIEKK